MRMSDPNYTPASQVKQTLDVALPFLLEKGITNEAAEVRQFALSLILKVCKVSVFAVQNINNIFTGCRTWTWILHPSFSWYSARDANYSGASRIQLPRFPY